MAKRHNEYARLLGTVENDSRPLTEQQGFDPLMTDVPDLHDIADSCNYMANKLQKHADHLHAMGDMQPSFNDQFSEGTQEDIGLPMDRY